MEADARHGMSCKRTMYLLQPLYHMESTRISADGVLLSLSSEPVASIIIVIENGCLYGVSLLQKQPYYTGIP